MIVDALAHATEDGKWFETGRDASVAALLASMDEHGVERAVLAGMHGHAELDFLARTAAAHPGRFIPVAGLDLSMGLNTAARTIAQAEELGFAGVKIYPRMSGVPLTDPLIEEVVDLAGEADMAAFICTIHRPPLPPLGRPVSDALHQLCAVCDNTRIVLVHGGYDDLLATSERIRPMEHVLLDLSLTLTRFAKASVGLDIAFLLESFDRRICVGTDFPETSWGDVMRAFGRIGFSGADLAGAGVLGENLLRFLAPDEED
ncbi:MAG: amidohydrolase family protein [Acidobacteriota bacterium]